MFKKTTRFKKHFTLFRKIYILFINPKIQEGYVHEDESRLFYYKESAVKI